MRVEKDRTQVVFVSPLYVKLSDKEVGFSGKTLRLRDFQRRLLDIFMDRETKHVVLLSAPTGAGKTFSLLIPLLANLEGDWLYFGSVGVYPSKELAKDQMVSVSNLLVEMGAEPCRATTLYEDLERLPEDRLRIIDEYVKVFEVRVHGDRIPVVLLFVSSDSLRDLRQALGVQSNFDLLSLLWEKVARRAFRIVFTVPEYPYLLASDVYRDFHGAGVWLHSVLQELYRFLRILGNDNKGFREWLEGLEERVGRRRVFEEYYVSRGFLNRLADMYLMFRAPVFFDEFHLYSGFSLPSFLSLLWIYMVERGVGKIIVSSATPERFVSVGRERKDFLKLVEQLATSMGYTFIRVDAETSSEAKPGFEQVRKKLEVRFVPVVLGGGSARGAAAYGLVQRCVEKLLRESDWLEKFKEKGRSLIVVDRFAAVLEAADAVRELAGEKPLVVTSSKVLFSDTFLQPSLADLRSAKLVVGNMAIAFGVDIKGMDLGVVAAKDFPSVVQKVGRFGRGRGDGTALVYLPIPFQKLMVVAELLEPFKGRKISHQDFIKLLEHIYPRRGAEALARTYVWVLKAVLPCWVYTFATIIRLRSEMMEKLVELANMSIQDLTKSETIVGRFASYLGAIGGFLDVVDLPKKLRLTVSRRVNLPPIGLYNLYSFRGLTTVTVKREAGGTVLEEDLSITTVGRNIPIELRDGEFRVRKNQAYGYMMLWLGIGGEEVKDRVRMLDGYVITLRAFADMVGGLLLYQGSPSGGGRMVCKLSAVDESADVWNAPVLVLYSRGRKSEKLIGMLSAMDSAIPIYITSGDTPVRLIGGVYIL